MRDEKDEDKENNQKARPRPASGTLTDPIGSSLSLKFGYFFRIHRRRGGRFTDYGEGA
jgi:hypothetical protein